MADKKRKGSRHKDRHTVSLPGDLYDLMKELADEQDRHLRQQVIIAVREHLRVNGKWPPPPAPEKEP